MMQFIQEDSVVGVRDSELLRAARHYRRAIDALGECTFEYLNPITAKKLRDHLEREMNTVTAELRRRGLSETDLPAAAAPEGSARGAVARAARMPEAV